MHFSISLAFNLDPKPNWSGRGYFSNLMANMMEWVLHGYVREDVRMSEDASHFWQWLIMICIHLPQVRLLYERVSNSKQKRPIMAHLDDPVIVYIPLIR